jgi:hypothetical protein
MTEHADFSTDDELDIVTSKSPPLASIPQYPQSAPPRFLEQSENSNTRRSARLKNTALAIYVQPRKRTASSVMSNDKAGKKAKLAEDKKAVSKILNFYALSRIQKV